MDLLPRPATLSPLMPTDRDIGLAIATIGVASWLYVWVMDGRLTAVIPVPVLVGLSLGMFLVSLFATIGGGGFAVVVASANRAIVAGLGILYAVKVTKWRLARRRHRTRDVA